MAAAFGYDRKGQGPPLVLLHPLGADRRVWRPVMGPLAAQREVWAVDLPGFGLSAVVQDTVPHPRTLADALIEFLTEQGLHGGRAHVAGNSLGGWVALELALAGHAASVTAIAPAGLWEQPLPPKPEIARRVARLVAPGVGLLMRPTQLRRVALAGVVARPERVPSQDAAALIGAYAHAPGFSAVNRAMRAGTFTSLEDIAVPIVLAWPEHDRLVARVRRLPPNAREIELPGCGHIPVWDDPDLVARALLEGSDHPLGHAPA